MPSKPLLSRVPKHFVKTITFDGGAGSGAVGTVAVGTVTGRILLQHLAAFCSTDLAGASATIELGVAGNTAELIAQATATNLDANEFWSAATPETGAAPALVDKLVALNIILTVGTANVTAGVIEISGFWLPLSVDGNLAV